MLQNDGIRYIALINTAEDASAKLSAQYDFSRLQYFSHLVRMLGTLHVGLAWCCPMQESSQPRYLVHYLHGKL